jgi:hypothetical protein
MNGVGGGGVHPMFFYSLNTLWTSLMGHTVIVYAGPGGNHLQLLMHVKGSIFFCIVVESATSPIVSSNNFASCMAGDR